MGRQKCIVGVSKTNCVYNSLTTNGGVYERSEFANDFLSSSAYSFV